jgi:hypothetical protein
MMSLFLVGFAIAPLFYGPASDRYGRRPIVVFACMLFIIGGVGCALAESLPTLLMWRVVQGAGASMTIVLAIIRDLFEGQAARTKLTVRRGASDSHGCDGARGAAAIVHNDPFSERIGQSFRNKSSYEVARATDRHGNNQCQVTCGIGRCKREVGRRKQCDDPSQQNGQNSHIRSPSHLVAKP